MKVFEKAKYLWARLLKEFKMSVVNITYSVASAIRGEAPITKTEAVTYYERPGSPQESYTGDVFRARRTFDVPYPQRWVFIKYMLGTATIEGTPTDNVIKRQKPDQYYVYYGSNGGPNMGAAKSFMVATGLESIECLGQQILYESLGTGSLLQTSYYDIARITINYESVTYRVEPLIGSQSVEPDEYHLSQFTTVFKQPTAEFLSLPFGAYKWVEFDENGIPLLDSKTKEPVGIMVQGAQGKIISASEIVVIHHKVPGIPAAIKTHIGSVNLYDWPELGAKKGQLLLTNVELKPYRWLEDQRLYDITFKMKFFDPEPAEPGSTTYAKQPTTEPRGHNWFLQHFPVSKNTDLKLPGAVAKVLQGSQSYKLITHNGFPPTEAYTNVTNILPKGAVAGNTVYKYKDFSLLFKNYEYASADGKNNVWMT